MTIPDIDIYRSAKIFVDQHGKLAHVEAVKKEEGFLVDGDTDGAIVWNRIAASY